jgi:hypothetical protein
MHNSDIRNFRYSMFNPDAIILQISGLFRAEGTSHILGLLQIKGTSQMLGSFQI